MQNITVILIKRTLGRNGWGEGGGGVKKDKERERERERERSSLEHDDWLRLRQGSGVWVTCQLKLPAGPPAELNSSNKI